jgi:hypothetical protein
MAAVRALTLATLALSAGAWAQVDGGTPAAPLKPKVAAPLVAPTTPVTRPAMKALGNAKEEDDAPLAPKSSPAELDGALLRAVLFAFEPAPTEIRIIAIEDLGLLGDPRSLNPLAQLVMDPNVNVQMAALRAIGAMQHPRSEAILANIVRHPLISERVKLAAIDALLFQNTVSSIAFLRQLSRGGAFHPVLQQQARNVLLDLPPGSTAAPGNSL